MYLFIINPVSGHGKSKKLHRHFKKENTYRELNAVFELTNYPNHAKKLTKQWLASEYKSKIETIVVIGGDGTLHEVINGLTDFDIPIAYIPTGSGNDFARAMKLASHKNAFLEYITSKRQTKAYWLGHVTFDQQTSSRFVNCLGFGFDAIVAQGVNDSFLKKLFNKIKLGKITYVLVLIHQLLFYQTNDLTMTIDGHTYRFKQCFLLVINNHPYFGGGMKINPNARNQSETLSVLVVDGISKWKVLALFGTVFIGKHLSFKEVKTYSGKKINIQSAKQMTYQIDGETGQTNEANVYKLEREIKIKV